MSVFAAYVFGMKKEETESQVLPEPVFQISIKTFIKSKELVTEEETFERVTERQEKKFVIQAKAPVSEAQEVVSKNEASEEMDSGLVIL